MAEPVTLEWTPPPGTGGFSGLLVAPDGRSFSAISDRGMRVDGMLHRRGGRLHRVSVARTRALEDSRGRVLRPPKSDAEGVAWHRSGDLLVAFEGQPVLLRYPASGAAPTGLAPLAAAGALPRNRGIEALATAPSGALWAFSESGGLIDGFPTWILDATGWQEGPPIPRQGLFLPVGADFGPDGDLYVLERAFLGIGFASRVRRFAVGVDTLGAGETVVASSLRQHDNLEGLSVWRDANGQLIATMVSDDNFSPYQRTEFVEYALP